MGFVSFSSFVISFDRPSFQVSYTFLRLGRCKKFLDFF